MRPRAARWFSVNCSGGGIRNKREIMADNSKTNSKVRSGILGAYEHHADALKRFIARFVHGSHDVDDVAQEAFLRAYSAEAQRPIEQPKSYLFRVAKNVALDQLRQRSRKPTDYLGDLEGPDVLASESTLEDELMAQQTLGIHCAAVASLPEKCRKVYLMRKVYGMRYKEIAESLDISVNTVEAHMTKAYTRCEHYVEKHMNDESVNPSQTIGRRGGR